MKYMGSKNRHAKHLLPIILANRKEGQCYVEPFVGGANMIDKVDGDRIGCDVNRWLIALLDKLSNGWLPPEQVTEEQYAHMKTNMEEYSDHLLGYVGFQLSYGAMWFGSYRRDKIGLRDYSAEAFRNILKQAANLGNIDFRVCSFNELEIPDNSVIYCDPPYEGTAKYKANEEEFNHDEFWKWCRVKAKEGHDVFISEYNAPDDFTCVWSKEVNSSLTKNTGGKKGVEKLFVHNTQINKTINKG